MDHGILNVPLTKRGDLDAEIDRWKREQQKAADLSTAERRATARSAKAALIQHEEAMVARYIGKFPDVRAHLRRTARFDPSSFLKLVEKFVAEAA